MFTRCALMGAVLLCGADRSLAQLVYVDAQDDFQGNPNQNLFCAAGGALSSCLVNNMATNGDNLWGFVVPETGVPSAGVASTYESNTENAPELRMRVAVPNGTYDAYAVFWADVNVQFLIRAGLTSNPGGNTLFGRTTGNGATVGSFGASAIWATPPEDNPNTNNTDDNDNDATNILNPLTGANPFLEHVPGGGGGVRLYLAPLGMVTASGGTGFDVFIDDFPSTNDQNRSRFEGVAYVPVGTDAILEAAIDRATGNLTVSNTTGAPLNISRYAISSPAGALDAAQWDTIAMGGNSSITEADAWTVTTNGAIVSGNWLLAENESGGSNGARLAATTGVFNVGNVWVKSPFEDALVSLELVGGAKVQLLPTYTGDTYDAGDFDGDYDVDAGDYAVLIGNLHVPVTTGLTQTQRYKLGDMNNNGTVNRDDFISFRTAFFAANPGSGAADWNAMVASLGGVPEPSSIALVAMASGLLLATTRRRGRGKLLDTRRRLATMCQSGRLGTGPLATGLVALFVGAVSATSSRAEDVTGWLPYQGNMNDLAMANTNDPVYGTGAANNIDNSGIYGSLQTPIVLNPSEESVLRGRVQILGHTGAGREFRYGMWKKVVQPTNPNTNPTTGWLGYMALNGAGAGAGRLEAKNPDGDFQTGLFISDFGGGSIAQFSGPAPACGSPLLDGSCNQGGPRYFLLAENAPNGNAGFANNLWYTFEIRVGRYGQDEATVSASLVSDPQPANGDFNNNGTVDAADYVLWRNGDPLANEGGVTPGMTTPEDYNTWRSNFGDTGTVPYTLNIGGGLDFNGNPPTDPVNNPTGTYTDHVTFEFDRVGFLFGGALDADQAIFQDVTINKNTIETVDLLVNTTTGATSIRNNLPASFDINYYEITSATNSLREMGGWASLDSLEGGDPIGQGWDEAGGSNDGILSEANLTGSLTLDQNESVSLGNAFRTLTNGGTQGAQNLRFFIGLTNGSVLRGTVTYAASAAASAVPEPASIALLCLAIGVLIGCHDRRVATGGN
jgi:hypothetical protein